MTQQDSDSQRREAMARYLDAEEARRHPVVISDTPITPGPDPVRRIRWSNGSETYRG